MKIRNILVMVVASMTLASMVSATEVNLSCVANASNGGGWQTDYMWMQGMESNAQKSYFLFDLSSIPTNAIVNSATVNTCIYYADSTWNPNWTFGAAEVTSAWNEAGTPGYASYGDEIDGSSIKCDSNLWIRNNITSLAQAWVSGNKTNYGVLVSKDTPNDGAVLAVRNRMIIYTDVRPYMLVDYTVSTVPEPSSILALVCGFAGMGGLVLRKR